MVNLAQLIERYPAGARAVLALIGIIVVLVSTRAGVGVHPDSAVFIGSARSLVEGHGLSVPFDWGLPAPMTLHGPLFPALLGGIGMLGIDPLDGARWLNALLFAANILLVGYVISRYAQGASYAATFGSFLMLTSVDIVGLHVSAMSEPTFFFFGLLGLYLLAVYFERPRVLPVAAAAIALASLARYAGVMLIVTGLIGILFLGRKAYRERIRDSVVFASISVLPLSLWIIRNLYTTSGVAARETAFHPVTLFHVTSALLNASAWFVPLTIPGMQGTARHILAFAVVTALAILGFLMLQKRHRRAGSDFTRQPLAELPFLLVAFMVAHVGLLAMYVSFVEMGMYVGARIITPIFVAGLVLVLSLGHRVLQADTVRSLRTSAIVVCVVLGGSYLVRLAPEVIRYASDGAGGYASRHWRKSEILKQVRALSPGTQMYSNGADAIYILTGRSAGRIPAKASPLSRRANTAYRQELTAMEEQLKNQGAVLVYFRPITRWYLPSEDELKRALPLKLVSQGPDGAIYGASD